MPLFPLRVSPKYDSRCNVSKNGEEAFESELWMLIELQGGLEINRQFANCDVHTPLPDPIFDLTFDTVWTHSMYTHHSNNIFDRESLF